MSLCDGILCAQTHITRNTSLHTLHTAPHYTSVVTWSNPDHAALLRSLWHGSMGPEETSPFPGVRHKLWKLLGFQGCDPQTDFRGMGALGLRVLVYAVENERHAPLMQRLLAKQQTSNYPLACAVINIVATVANLLSLDRKELVRPMTQHALFRVFCRSTLHAPTETIDELTRRLSSLPSPASHSRTPTPTPGHIHPSAPNHARQQVSRSSTTMKMMGLSKSHALYVPPAADDRAMFSHVVMTCLELIDHLYTERKADYFAFGGILDEV